MVDGSELFISQLNLVTIEEVDLVLFDERVEVSSSIVEETGFDFSSKLVNQLHLQNMASLLCRFTVILLRNSSKYHTVLYESI
jgi:hypothetical protein